LKNHLELNIHCHSEPISRKAAELGYVAMIMFMSGSYSTFQMRTLNFWITPAIDHQQILFLFDNTARPIGYVTWAHLAPDTEHRLLNNKDFLLHPSEWNEGGKTWLIDFCFPCGGVMESRAAIKKHLKSKGVTELFWAHRKTDYSIKKTWRVSL